MEIYIKLLPELLTAAICILTCKYSYSLNMLKRKVLVGYKITVSFITEIFCCGNIRIVIIIKLIPSRYFCSAAF